MWQYIGNGSHTTGIPPRDLTDAEWAAIPQWLRDIALGHGFYVNVVVTVPDVVVTDGNASTETQSPQGDVQPPPTDPPAKKNRKAVK